MFQIAQLLEIPGGQLADTPLSVFGLRGGSVATGSKAAREHRQLFSTVNRVPGVASALRRESMPGYTRTQMIANRAVEVSGESSSQSQTPRKPITAAFLRESSAPIACSSAAANKSRDSSKSRTPRSRDGSPRMPRPK